MCHDGANAESEDWRGAEGEVAPRGSGLASVGNFIRPEGHSPSHHTTT